MFYTRNIFRDRLFKSCLSLKSRPLLHCDHNHRESSFCSKRDIGRSPAGHWRINFLYNAIYNGFPPFVNTEDIFYVASKTYKELLWLYDGGEFDKNTSACPRIFKKRIFDAIESKFQYKSFDEALRSKLGRTNNKDDKRLVEIAIQYGYWMRDLMYKKSKKDTDNRFVKAYVDKEWQRYAFQNLKEGMKFKLFESTGEAVVGLNGNTIFEAGSDARLNQDGIFMIDIA